MSRIAYVNGAYVPHTDAAVHIEDRGFQFADGVYEVCEIRGGRIYDEARHLGRLARSLRELKIRAPMGDRAMRTVISEVIRRNRVHDGLVYIQVTRGVARRDFLFPGKDVTPTLVMTARSASATSGDRAAQTGIAVKSVPENRWERVDIKTVGLLPNVLAKEQAKAAGAKEAWFVDRDGFVTEGGSSNAWIITPDGCLVTRPAESGILRGITRTTLLDLAREEGLRVEERGFTIEEAKAAKEAFITSATQVVMPVVMIDGATVGNGEPGLIVGNLRRRFHEIAEHRTI